MSLESSQSITSATRKAKAAPKYFDPTVDASISKDDTATTTSSPDTAYSHTMDSDQHMMATGCRSLLEDDDEDDDISVDNAATNSLQRHSKQVSAIRRDPSPTGAPSLTIDTELRDQPQPMSLSSTPPSSYSGFDPTPRSEYIQDWESFYTSAICAHGVLPVCNGHFAEQLDFMTVGEFWWATLR